MKLIIITFLMYSCTHSKFSGYVHDFDSGQPIKNVSININGNKTLTDSTGYFNLSVNSNSSCVIDLKKEGYAIKKVIHRPDFTSKNEEPKLKNKTIYMFKNESDFYNGNK